MAEAGKSLLDDTCSKLLDAMKKRAEQELGDEDQVPFLDNLEFDRTKDSDISDITDTYFDTSSANEEWSKAHNDSSSGDGDEIAPRATVAYFSAWKKALLKFYSRNSDVEAVFGNGVEFINTGAQSIEATRLSYAHNDNASSSNKK